MFKIKKVHISVTINRDPNPPMADEGDFGKAMP